MRRGKYGKTPNSQDLPDNAGYYIFVFPEVTERIEFFPSFMEGKKP